MSRILFAAFESPPGDVVIVSADTSTATVTVVFTSVNAAEYSLDGGGWLAATSPLVLGPLASAAHTLALRDVTDHTKAAVLVWAPGSSSSPALGNETTEEAIRDRAIALIALIAPHINAGDAFNPFRNPRAADFYAEMEAAPASAVRRYQVRTSGNGGPPEVSNSDFEEMPVTLTILVAYPQIHRWGSDNALDRDDVIESDRKLIQKAIGIYGRANFSPPHPDACWRSGNYQTIRGGRGVDYLEIVQAMTYRGTV